MVEPEQDNVVQFKVVAEQQVDALEGRLRAARFGSGFGDVA